MAVSITNTTKKFVVFQRISEQSDPVSMPELLAILGEGYAERSVRRWLNEMIEEGSVTKTGAKRGTRYHVPKYEMRDSSCFSKESMAILKRTSAPVYEREPVAYSEGFLKAYKPNATVYIPQAIRQELHKKGKRSKDHEPAGTYARHIFNRLLIDLSFNSSRLEGNTYSLLETEQLLLEGASAAGKLDVEKIMILNHKEPIRFLVDSANRLEVVEATIFTLHFLLSEGLVHASQAGKVRTTDVRISGCTYIPYSDPTKLKKQLSLIYEKAAAIDDPFEQSLFLLLHISYLQAFADVNKRTARLAANIPLVKHNFVPLSFNDVETDDYRGAMIAFYELQEIGPMLDLFTFSYLRTCATYNATVEAVGFDEVRVRYRQDRQSIVRKIILRQLVRDDMSRYIQEKAQQIPAEDRADFVEDVLEDLTYIDQARIAGLGITPEQLNNWLLIR